MIPSIAPDGRHGVRLRRFIGHTAANLLDVEEVTTSEGLAALAPAWDGLHERSGAAHPFLTHAFVREYWEAFGEPGALLVLIVRRYGQVVAIAPLVRRHRTMYGLSVRAIETLRHPHAPRSDVLLSTHPAQACGAMLEHLLRLGSSWDVLELSNFPPSSVAYREMRRIARFAGLLTGVEGYIESCAMGLLVAWMLAGERAGRPLAPPPPTTMFGGLYQHVTAPRDAKYKYGPTNVNYGLLPPLDGVRKDNRKQRMSERARLDLEAWLATVPSRAAA